MTRDYVEDILVNNADEMEGVSLKQDDCFVCCILTCETLGQLRAYDKHGVYNINDVCDYFHPNKCPSLLDKPKIFIFSVSKNLKA